ncbi:MAG: hypothetical protein LBP96_04475, partial [Bacteroidales bacterium]|nr:hypothetical protein [Bacteroidales bacterium]
MKKTLTLSAVILLAVSSAFAVSQPKQAIRTTSQLQKPTVFEQKSRFKTAETQSQITENKSTIATLPKLSDVLLSHKPAVQPAKSPNTKIMYRLDSVVFVDDGSKLIIEKTVFGWNENNLLEKTLGYFIDEWGMIAQDELILRDERIITYEEKNGKTYLVAISDLNHWWKEGVKTKFSYNAKDETDSAWIYFYNGETEYWDLKSVWAFKWDAAGNRIQYYVYGIFNGELYLDQREYADYDQFGRRTSLEQYYREGTWNNDWTVFTPSDPPIWVGQHKETVEYYSQGGYTGTDFLNDLKGFMWDGESWDNYSWHRHTRPYPSHPQLFTEQKIWWWFDGDWKAPWNSWTSQMF